MTAAAIRKAFLDFFKSKEHLIVPSAPIVVKNDPTLMFTNAGMNQFKDYFLGNAPAPSARIGDTQKCLRVSGKHNDLEEVGVDTYHHTMFEMLGNWSFGGNKDGYFKTEAIAWSWELLTKVLNIPEDRLYVTVFEGDAKENLQRDEESESEWKKWIQPDRIINGNKKDNFWEMGDTGPCGPCTEIHVDTRPDSERAAVAGATLVNADHPQVIEIWNNVFIQFNRLKDGSLQPLPAKHVDTGMGFERLVRVIQGKSSNYDTDVFTGTIEAITKITGTTYTGGDNKKDIAIRVNADHLRAISFTIADGQLPSNTAAGYVIRRILRRAVRYYYSYLNYQQPLLFQLVPVLAEEFKDVFPELKSQEAFVSRVIKEEEEAFLRTLEKGLKRIETIISSTKGEIGGREAFELNDTYGFPLDLTSLIAAERGLTVDAKGFEEARKEQQQRGREAGKIDTEDWVNVGEGDKTIFTGYDSLEEEARLIKYRKVKAKGKEAFQLVLDRTPFYAESGGQVGDTGVLQFDGEAIPVLDTKKENDLIVHITEQLPAKTEGEVKARVDEEKREGSAAHHSATHLLHAALKNVLGNHVAQKGSLVSPNYLRFDFSHFSKMTDEEIQKVESLVNEKIRKNLPVVIKSMGREEAMNSGATALFGEKYGDVVRVVTIDPSYSVELCGGTHVGSTGALGYFRITSESAVAAGVRRIEALTGAAAIEEVNKTFELLENVRTELKNPKDLLKSVRSLGDENSELRKKLEKLEGAQLTILRDELLQKQESFGNSQFIGAVVDVSSADALKKLAFDLKPKLKSPIVVLASAIEGKAAVAVLLSEELVKEKGLDAGALIRQHVAPLIKGGGGGQKSMATAGGTDISRLPEVISTLKSALS